MRRIAYVLATLAIGWFFAVNHAAALDVSCIEASRYKYLFQLFGGDTRKFIAYFNLPAGQLPRPEYCRAALLDGGLSSDEDVTKVIKIIGDNHGWLATLYLRSGGGLVRVGVGIGILARNFWLKTYAASQRRGIMDYQPDFAMPPPDKLPITDLIPDNAPTLAGWQAYRASIAKLPPIKMGGSEMFCASACTQIHAGGIDRKGISRVHRASGNAKTLLATNEGLIGTDDFLVSFYRFMDAGPDFMRMYLLTTSATTTPLPISRFARHVSDVLAQKCGADADQLARLEAQIDASVADFGSQITFYGPSINLEHLRTMAARVRMRRMAAEQCVAAINEAERLTAYAGLCQNGCDQKKLNSLIVQKRNDIQKTIR